MQNTMVEDLWENNEKGERKTEENDIKNGGKGLKMYLFGL